MSNLDWLNSIPPREFLRLPSEQLRETRRRIDAYFLTRFHTHLILKFRETEALEGVCQTVEEWMRELSFTLEELRFCIEKLAARGVIVATWHGKEGVTLRFSPGEMFRILRPLLEGVEEQDIGH